jgi:hypothetical protein
MVRLPDAAGQLQNAEDVRYVKNARARTIPTIRNILTMSNISNISNIISIPVRVLRGLFSGVGQLLLAADRFRDVGTEHERYGQDEQFDPPTGLDGEAPARDERRGDGDARPPAQIAGGRAHAGRHARAAGSQASRGRAGARPRAGRRGQAAKPTRFRSLDSTGNVRILTADMPAETPGAARPKAASRPSPKHAARSRSKTTSRARAETAAPAAKAAPPPAAPAAPAAAPADLPVPGYDGLSLPSIRARLRGLDAAQLRVLCDHEKSGANRADVVTMFERRIAKLEAAARDAT